MWLTPEGGPQQHHKDKIDLGVNQLEHEAARLANTVEESNGIGGLAEVIARFELGVGDVVPVLEENLKPQIARRARRIRSAISDALNVGHFDGAQSTEDVLEVVDSEVMTLAALFEGAG